MVPENSIYSAMATSSNSMSDSTDAFFMVTEGLVPSIPRKFPTTTIVDFSGLLTAPLVLETDLKEGCGGELWPAGKVLAKYLIQCKMDDLRGKSMFVCSDVFSSPLKNHLQDVNTYVD